MKTHTLIISMLILFGSCAPTKMYYWGKYDQASYKHNKNQSKESQEELFSAFDDIIKKKNKGTRKVVPPGVYADYGFLLIKDGQIQKGKEMLEKELALYPESRKMVDYILNKL